MPNPVPAADTGLPVFGADAELVRLGRELEEAALIARIEPQQDMREKIECIEAIGLAGLFVKARALELALKDHEPNANAPGSLLRLTKSLISDFRAIRARMMDCPVEKIAHAASEIIQASRVLGKGLPETQKEAEGQFMERLGDLEHAATSALARSAYGAMAQICVISELIVEIEENGFSARIHRRLNRSLYSIMSVLEATAGERAEVCRRYYMSPELDPFARPELEAKLSASG
ncbi:MAG TPA: hypothetical protein VMU56_03830 [Beijerinckiaceae bacterium]|nr:hypothetical protein [Beijerinckiaceae bacterium]